jgi:nicotinate-nucleotide pyrophosphorylase (carboxylating)
VAQVLSREPAVLCGARWFDHVFQTLDPSVRIERRAQDDEIEAGHALCPLSGSARALWPIQGWMLYLLPELGFRVSW